MYQTIIYALCLILTLVFVYVFIKRRNAIPPHQRIPELPGWVPVLQHIPSLMKIGFNHLEYFRSCSDKYGKIWQFYIPPLIPVIQKADAVVFTTDPEVLKYVLSTGFKEGVFAKGPEMAIQHREFLGKGIFTSNGERWRDTRNFASSLFHVDGLKQYVDIFHNNTVKLFEKFSTLNEPRGIDIQDYFMRYTLDSFCEIGFGIQIDSISAESNDFAKAFDVVQYHSAIRGHFGKLWKIKEKIIRPTEFYKNLDYMNNFVFEIINERKKESPEQLAERSDLLSKLLTTNKNATNEELRDFVMNFLIAGRDTTAVLLTWCIYLLASHSDVVEKILAEIKENLAEDETPTFQNTKSLVYMKQVLQETLRLYPPVPIDGFDAEKDCILPGGYKVEKGSPVLYCAWDLHRRPEYWGADSLAFKPERFANPPAPFTWIPFHAGPRECLGKEMAYLEAKIMLCNFLRKYNFSLETSHVVETKQGIILTALNGVVYI